MYSLQTKLHVYIKQVMFVMATQIVLFLKMMTLKKFSNFYLEEELIWQTMLVALQKIQVKELEVR